MINLEGWSITAVLVLLFLDATITRSIVSLAADKKADSNVKIVLFIFSIPFWFVGLYFAYLMVHGYQTQNIYELIAGIAYYIYFAIAKAADKRTN